MMTWRELSGTWSMLRRMPSITVDLMCSDTSGNDPFFEQMTREYFASTQKRHPRFPLVKVDQYGVALLELPATFEGYFMMLEGSARRNFKKARRKGYRFREIDFNDYLDDVRRLAFRQMESKTDEDFAAPETVRPWTGPTYLSRMLYLIRNTQQHIGDMNRVLAFHGCDAMKWH